MLVVDEPIALYHNRAISLRTVFSVVLITLKLMPIGLKRKGLTGKALTLCCFLKPSFVLTGFCNILKILKMVWLRFAEIYDLR